MVVGANSVVTKVRAWLVRVCECVCLSMVTKVRAWLVRVCECVCLSMCDKSALKPAGAFLCPEPQIHIHTTTKQDIPSGQTIVGIPARAIGKDRATYVDTNAEAIRSVGPFRTACMHVVCGCVWMYARARLQFVAD